MLHVTAADCGEWIPGFSNIREETIFMINVIELAMSNDMDISDAVAADIAVARAGVADNDTFLRLFSAYEDAMIYLQDLLPENFWFSAQEWGLYLVSEAPDGSIIGY